MDLKQQQTKQSIKIVFWYIIIVEAVKWAIFLMLFIPLIMRFTPSEDLTGLLALPVDLVLLWLGVLVAARYVNKKYSNFEKREVIKFATMFFVIPFVSRLVKLGFTSTVLFALVGVAIETAAFYLLSRKYLRQGLPTADEATAR